MGDTSVQKVKSEYSPKGKMGQKYLASGIHVSMRLWEGEQPGEAKCIWKGRWCCSNRAIHGSCRKGRRTPTAFWSRSPLSRRPARLPSSTAATRPEDEFKAQS